jgi:transposase
MGRRLQTTAMFQYFCLDDWVPADHLLRAVDRCIDFKAIREEVRPLYSDVGRPSIDPEVLLRILLVGYLYGITSERRLMDEVGLNLAYRWFTGLGFDQSIPDHSTFSKNRHGRFRESGVFREFFEGIVRQCIAVGLVQGERLSVDGTVIAANASAKSRVPREALPEAAKVSRTVQEYLLEIETENDNPKSDDSDPHSPPGKPPTLIDTDGKVSTSDPDAAWASKGGALHLSYYDNYLIDNASNIILDVEATPARTSQEIVAVRQMLEHVASRFDVTPTTLAADKGYGTGPFLAWLVERNITPHVPVLDRTQQTEGRYTRSNFVFEPDANAYRCPNGKLLNYCGIDRTSRVNVYRASPSDCGSCPLKAACTAGRARRLVINFDEPVREFARQLASTDAYRRSCRERKKVEALFAELKDIIKLRRFRLRRLWNVKEQTLLAATAQNIRRLIRFLAPPIGLNVG